MKSGEVENFTLKNHPLRGNFENFVPKGFIATPIYGLCSKFSEAWQTENR